MQVRHESRCDECSMYPIIGPLYTCTGRNNYDLCSSCEKKRIQPFPMMKTYAPARPPTYQPVQATYQPVQATYQPAQSSYQPAQASYQPNQPVKHVYVENSAPQLPPRQTAVAAGQSRHQDAEIRNFKKASNDAANSFGEEPESIVVHHRYYDTTVPVQQSYANVEEKEEVVVHHLYYDTTVPVQQSYGNVEEEEEEEEQEEEVVHHEYYSTGLAETEQEEYYEEETYEETYYEE